MANRTTEIGGIWANGAGDPPPSPISETTYADSGITQPEIEAAWPYGKIVDSSKFNEVMRRVTLLLGLLEVYGILPWSADTDYVIGSLVVGSDAQKYKAVIANAGVDPISDGGTNWTLDSPAEIPAGTKMLFPQASAPTGWTQDTTQNDYMLRVVSGTGGGVGGSDSPILMNKVPSHTHITDDPGDHHHTQPWSSGTNGTTTSGSGLDPIISITGEAGAHTHSTVSQSPSGSNWTPKYKNIVQATKN